MNIALLGGSFDPPHNGHLIVAKEILRVLPIDEVWMVPAFSHPFHKNISAVSDRLAMTKFLKQGSIKVIDHEAKQKKISYSIDTLNELQKKFPSYKFFWTIGSDHVAVFQKWKDWQEILTNYKLVIFERTESPKELQELVNKSIPNDLQKNAILITSPQVETSPVSSSKIRDLVKHEQSIAIYVPKEIESYIRKHGLYR